MIFLCDIIIIIKQDPFIGIRRFIQNCGSNLLFIGNAYYIDLNYIKSISMVIHDFYKKKNEAVREVF